MTTVTLQIPDEVFAVMREDPTRCIIDCDHAWGRVKEHAPIADVRIHDLRRTAASWATQAGAPISAVGKFIGDKSINATAVYARADVTAARADRIVYVSNIGSSGWPKPCNC